MKTATCSKCPASVIFVVTVRKDGSRGQGIVDASPARNGNIRVIEMATGEVEARVLTKAELEHARRNDQPLHLSHFVTCPEAASFRRAG